MVLVLAKCEKINNAQATGSAIIVVLEKMVIVVLKKLSQLSGKSCDSYPEIAITIVIRQQFTLGRCN